MEILSFPPRQQMEVVAGGEYKTFTESELDRKPEGTSGSGQIGANPNTIVIVIVIIVLIITTIVIVILFILSFVIIAILVILLGQNPK